MPPRGEFSQKMSFFKTHKNHLKLTDFPDFRPKILPFKASNQSPWGRKREKIMESWNFSSLINSRGNYCTGGFTGDKVPRGVLRGRKKYGGRGATVLLTHPSFPPPL